MNKRNCKTYAEQKAYLIAQLDKQIAKAEKNLQTHLTNIQKGDAVTNGNILEDEKLYSKLDEEIKKLNAEREKIETKFDVATDIFDEYINNMNKPPSGSGSDNKPSGSKPSKDKEIADIEETTDWYIALNNAIDDNNRLLEENRNAQKHANGTQKIALMKKEVELLEKQAHAKKQLEGAYFAELTQSKSYLRNQGFEIDSMDNLVNASAKILQLKQQANKLSGAEKEAAIKRIELIEKQIDRFTELSNNLIPSLQGEYEELNNSIKDLYKDQLNLVANTEKEIYEVIEHYEGKKKDTKLKAIEEQRKALEELYSLEDRNDDLEKKQSNLADIKNQMDLYENAQDSAGKAKYEELKKQYDDLLKELNTTIRDNQKDSILDSLEAQKENVEKEYEEFLKPENINKIISDAMKDGYIKLGDEVLDLNNVTTQYLAETTKGTQNLINANNELLNSYLSIMEIAKDLPKLNANVGNIGVNLNTVHSGMPRSNIGKSVNFENITVQITGGTNMNQADITKAVQKAFIDISNNYKF